MAVHRLSDLTAISYGDRTHDCNLFAYIPCCSHSEEAGLSVKRIQAKTHIAMNLHIVFSGQMKSSIFYIIFQNISGSVWVTLVSQEPSLKQQSTKFYL